MCGRYQFTEPQNADLRRILQDVRRRCGDRCCFAKKLKRL